MDTSLLTSDNVNAMFEGLAALSISNHCLVLYKDKQVRGIKTEVQK